MQILSLPVFCTFLIGHIASINSSGIKVLSWGVIWCIALSFGCVLVLLLLHVSAARRTWWLKGLLPSCTFSRIPLFFRVPCVTVDFSVSPSLFPSPILLLTPPPAMEMNFVLWIWGWRWGLQQISNPACKTASWLAANVLQVLSSQPEFLSAITWPWIPRQRNVHAFFF